MIPSADWEGHLHLIWGWEVVGARHDPNTRVTHGISGTACDFHGQPLIMRLDNYIIKSELYVQNIIRII